MSLTGLFMIALGIYLIWGAALDHDWFMGHYKAATFVWLFGRQGARVVYALLGTITLIGGLLAILGVINL